MLWPRIATAVLGIPLFAAALYYGGLTWALLMALLAAVGSKESARLLGGGAAPPWTGMSQSIACLLVVAAYIASGVDVVRWNKPTLIGPIVALVIAWHSLGGREETKELSAAGTTLAAALYPGVFLAQLVFLRDTGLPATIFAVSVTWATDTLAYVVGSTWGKRPLWPSVSPNKTVEGAVGGLAGAAAAGFLLGSFLGSSPWSWVGVAVPTSLFAQVGDLVESGLKRRAGVKDSGTLLPGHGGVLDRFDSLFFAGTVVYYLHAFLR